MPETNQTWRQSVLLKLLFSLPLRLALLLIIAIPPVVGITDWLAPLIVKNQAEALAAKVAASLGSPPLGHERLLKVIGDYHLSWCYVTEGGANLSPQTAPFAPALPAYKEFSREIGAGQDGALFSDESSGEVVGMVTGDDLPSTVPIPQPPLMQRYYEVVVPFANKTLLHVGIPLEPITPQILALSDLTRVMLAPSRTVDVCLVAGLMVLVVMAASYFLVSVPLEIYAEKFRRAFLSGATADLSNLLQLRLHLFTVSEIADMFEELQTSMSRFTSAGKSSESTWKPAQKVRIDFSAMKTEKQEPDSSGLLAVLEADLAGKIKSADFASALLSGLKQAFGGIDKAAFIAKSRNSTAGAVISKIDADDALLKVLVGLERRQLSLAAKDYIELGPMSLRQHGLESMMEQHGIRRVLYFRLRNQDEQLGLVVLLSRSEDGLAPEKLRSIELLMQRVSASFAKLLLTEQLQTSKYTDDLTGLPNKRFALELISRTIDRDKSFSVLLLSLDHLDEFVQKYGLQSKDALVKRLAELLRQRFPQTSQEAEGSWLMRFDSHHFIVLDTRADQDKALELAESVRHLVSSTRQWVGDIEAVTISIGIATAPNQLAEGTAGLVAGAQDALRFAQNVKKGNSCAHILQLPGDYKSSSSDAMFGELGVLDPASLLQSLAFNVTDGTVHVEEDSGRVFSLVWRQGMPYRAELGSLQGYCALMEFLVMFKHGSFGFFSSSAESAPVGESNLSAQAIERYCIKAALSQDRYNLAIQSISRFQTVSLCNQEQWQERWKHVTSDFTEDECAWLRKLLAALQRPISVSQLFASLNDFPSYLKWVGVYGLAEHGLLALTAAGVLGEAAVH